MSAKIDTYNPKSVTVACGSHIVSGYADDSFINIEANGDGITKKVGCDGAIARAISPDNSYKVKISLLQSSKSNDFFQKMVDKDRSNGSGVFPLLIKDLSGGLVFSTDAAWCVKKAPVVRGKETNNREWELETGDATLNG